MNGNNTGYTVTRDRTDKFNIPASKKAPSFIAYIKQGAFLKAGIIKEIQICASS